MVTATAVRAALFAMSAVAATISPPARIAPDTTSVPRAIASVTGFVIALRFDALFVVLRLRDAFARFEAVFVARDALFVVLRLRATFARFEAVFVARDALFVVLRWRDAFARFEAVFVAVFAAVRPRALPPPTLARDLDAVAFADVLLRGAAVLETVVFFLASDVFLAGRPRALIPPRDFEAVVFDDLAIHNSFELDSRVYLRPARVSSLIESAGKGASSLGRLGTTSKRPRRICAPTLNQPPEVPAAAE